MVGESYLTVQERFEYLEGFSHVYLFQKKLDKIETVSLMDQIKKEHPEVGIVYNPSENLSSNCPDLIGGIERIPGLVIVSEGDTFYDSIRKGRSNLGDKVARSDPLSGKVHLLYSESGFERLDGENFCYFVLPPEFERV
jgi:hypothetical protein